MRYTAFSNVGKFYTRDSLAVAQSLMGGSSASSISSDGNPLPSGGTTHRAQEEAIDLLDDEVKRIIASTMGAIVLDEANTKFSGRAKALAHMYGSAAVGKPLLMGCIMDLRDYLEDGEDAAGVKPSVRAARAIRADYEKKGLDINKVATCIVGDNAAFIDAVAAELGLPRLRCIPHCLALVYAVLSAPFKRFVTATAGLAALRHAGGGTARDDALREAGIEPRHLNCKGTRWGQVLAVGENLVSAVGEATSAAEETILFSRIRAVIDTHPSFAPRKAAVPKPAATAAPSGGAGGGRRRPRQTRIPSCSTYAGSCCRIRSRFLVSGSSYVFSFHCRGRGRGRQCHHLRRSWQRALQSPRLHFAHGSADCIP